MVMAGVSTYCQAFPREDNSTDKGCMDFDVSMNIEI